MTEQDVRDLKSAFPRLSDKDCRWILGQQERIRQYHQEIKKGLHLIGCVNLHPATVLPVPFVRADRKPLIDFREVYARRRKWTAK